MNNIMITNCEVIPYSSEEPVGFVVKENDYGKFSMFRVLEHKNRSQPVCWFVKAEAPLTERIINMKIVPGDSLILTGEIFTYKDLKRKKESYRILLTSLDYNKPLLKKEEEQDLESTVLQEDTVENIIKKNEAEIFVKNINLQ